MEPPPGQLKLETAWLIRAARAATGAYLKHALAEIKL